MISISVGTVSVACLLPFIYETSTVLRDGQLLREVGLVLKYEKDTGIYRGGKFSEYVCSFEQPFG